MFILHINTIILALLYLGQCTNMLIITALVCHSAVSGYLSYSRSTPFLNGLSPIIMSCAARKKLMLCIRWMRTVYIDFIFIGNIPAIVFITIKNTTHNIKKKFNFFFFILALLRLLEKENKYTGVTSLLMVATVYKVSLDVALRYYFI